MFLFYPNPKLQGLCPIRHPKVENNLSLEMPLLAPSIIGLVGYSQMSMEFRFVLSITKLLTKGTKT